MSPINAEVIAMQCSVCGAPAQNITPPDFDGLVVRCSHCREYEIEGTVVNRLLRLTLTERMDALQAAKQLASPGVRPSITSACF